MVFLENFLVKNVKETQLRRETWIDIVRGIGSILVIIGHASCPSELQNFIFGFHIPLFFILSGYLHNQEKWENKGFGKYILRKIKAFVLPYFVFSIINLVLDMLLKRNEDYFAILPKYIFGILYSSSKYEDLPNCTPLWFLPTLFVSSIFIFIVLRIKSAQKKLWISVFCVGAITVNVILFKNNIPTFPWHVEVALVGAMYMIIGYYIKQLKLLEKAPMLLLFILLAAGSALNIINGGLDMNTVYFGNVFLSIPASVIIPFFIMSVFYRTNFKGWILKLIGRNSMYVMAFNYMVNALYVIIFLRFKVSYNWILVSGFNVVVFMALGYLIVSVKKKCNIAG